MLQGKDLILSIDIPNVGTRAIAAAKSCDFELSTDFIGICAPHGSGGWKHNKPTTLSWSVSSSNLVADQADVETLIDLQIAKTPLLLRFYDCELKTYRKGYAYIASIKESGSKGDLVSLSISFTPAGALENIGWEPITLTTEYQHEIITCTSNQVIIEGHSSESIMLKKLVLTAPARIKLDAPYGTCIVVYRGEFNQSIRGNITSLVEMHAHQNATPRIVEKVVPAGTYSVLADKTDLQKTTPPTAIIKKIV